MLKIEKAGPREGVQNFSAGFAELSPIHEIVKVDLEELPEYETVSCTCGDPKKKRPVPVCEKGTLSSQKLC